MQLEIGDKVRITGRPVTGSKYLNARYKSFQGSEAFVHWIFRHGDHKVVVVVGQWGPTMYYNETDLQLIQPPQPLKLRHPALFMSAMAAVMITVVFMALLFYFSWKTALLITCVIALFAAAAILGYAYYCMNAVTKEDFINE